MAASYPVPHCSILVMFSWSRLFNQPRSSCLCRENRVSRQFYTTPRGWTGMRGKGRTWIHPWWGNDNRGRG